MAAAEPPAVEAALRRLADAAHAAAEASQQLAEIVDRLTKERP